MAKKKEYDPSAISPFTFVEQLSNGKQNLMVDDETEKAYVPFVVNRALSFDRETIIYANAVNKMPTLSKRMQHDFLLNTIKRKSRRFAWIKTPKSDYTDDVMEYYDCSYAKASQYLTILSDEQLKTIEKRLDKGGRK
jgi:hypothetical protein